MKIQEKLLNFQLECPPIKKDGKVSFGKTSYNYATLENIVSVVRPLLAKQGLAFSFGLAESNVYVTLKSIDSDEVCYSDLNLPQTSDPKIMGSNITYYKRYLLTAILGIVTDDDNSEVERPVSKAKLTDAQFAKAIEKIQSGESGVVKQLLIYFDLSEKQHTELLLLENGK